MNPQINQSSEWIMIAPSGKLAIARRPSGLIPKGARVATDSELLCANRGNPFPWGNLPEPHINNRQWHDKRLGVGGLFHEQWFVTTDSRFGGAKNVPIVVPGSLRSSMLYDGGGTSLDFLLENEGYAIIKESTANDQQAFREIQMYSATHVMADGGAIVCSPISPDKTIYVGFVGRCQICPNAELISYEQLKSALPKYKFELWPEWKNWSIGPVSKASEEAFLAL